MSTQTISTTLPGNVAYVSGTVNDKAYTWTLVDTAWEAIVDRADDEIYRVALTAITTLGTSVEYNFTLYYGLLNLITDRTQADVSRAKTLAAKGWAGLTAEEQALWTASLKGSYNATDLNRVGGAVQYVATRLKGVGYPVVVHPKQDWQTTDIPTSAQLYTYLQNVATIRAALAVLPSTPPVPDDMQQLTWQEANNIEQILLDVDMLVSNMIQAWFYAGDLYSGEV